MYTCTSGKKATHGNWEGGSRLVERGENEKKEEEEVE